MAPWHVRGGRPLLTGAPFGIMGIVNVTPDSFFDGGEHFSPAKGAAHALRLLAQGADILDLGGESSRPGARAVGSAVEQARLLPTLAALRQKAPSAVISVDTCRARTAASVLAMGADIINDISACACEPDLLDVLVQHKPGYVLMHSRGTPQTMQTAPRYADVRCEVRSFFEKNLDRLVRAGLPEDRIALDPGIGFGKDLGHNLALLSHPEDWLGFGRPVVMGLSMKSFLGELLGLATKARTLATSVATALLWRGGVFWHRVHDVAGARQSLLLASALSGGGAS